jgi:hypothetical protein
MVDSFPFPLALGKDALQIHEALLQTLEEGMAVSFDVSAPVARFFPEERRPTERKNDHNRDGTKNQRPFLVLRRHASKPD